MRRRFAVPLSVLAALTVLLAGCQPAVPPAPSPTTPVPAPTPKTTPTENAQEREERIAYAQAEATLRAFRAEFGRLLNEGGAPVSPDSLRRLAGGQMLESAALSLKQAHELGARTVGTARLVSVVAGGYSRDEVTVRTCEDGSHVRVLRGKKELGRGSIVAATYLVRRTGKGWRVWSTSQNAVKSCID